MLIIGCDYHPGFQQIACVDTDTGELSEHRLAHREEAEAFYRGLKPRNLSARVGMESSGHSRWFERLLGELQFELWIGDPAEIRTKRVRKQKTDRQDAQLLLRLMLEDRFPRIWVPDAENRDLRQLLWHRHRLVQMRTRVMNQLHVVALNEGLRRKKALWRPAGRTELESIVLAPWATRRRQDLLDRTRPTDAEDSGTDTGAGRGSGEAPGDATADDASRRRSADGTGLRVGDRDAGALPLRQAAGQLHRAGSDGGVQRRSSSTGTHQQARQRAAAVSAGGSGAGHGAQSAGVAQQVLPPRHATGTQDREGSDGAKAGGASVLDVASGPRLRPDAEARFARGRARTSRWCAINHRCNDWASRSQ